MASPTLLWIIFHIAVAAEAMTAALAAGRRRMDWFGVCVLACVTALGGGTMRDTLLGHYPLTWVANPYLLLMCCGAALLTIALARFMDRLRWPFLLLDALGLVVFTIIGCNIGLEMGLSPIIVIVSGMITGVVGGIMRDILCNDVPLIFSGELYASVSIVTGVLYLGGLGLGLPADVVILGAIAIGFALRVLAIVLKLEMPRFVYDKDLR
ncbi:MAG: trimeric intracellular cation channel family protein [Devosia sp.]